MDERAPQSSHCNYFVQNHVKLKTMPTTYRPRRVDGETIKPRLFDATSPISRFQVRCHQFAVEGCGQPAAQLILWRAEQSMYSRKPTNDDGSATLTSDNHAHMANHCTWAARSTNDIVQNRLRLVRYAINVDLSPSSGHSGDTPCLLSMF